MGEGRSESLRLFSDVSSGVDDPYLARALTLAERGRGSTAPNPVVGCVIVVDGRIVGEGFHARAGEPHAEVFALREAGDAARGADVYVTLEPCSHLGRTPPCTEALIAAGVARVVVGLRDPNPGSTDGAGRLRDAGIEVVFAAEPTPFAAQNEGWLKRIALGLPFVTAKIGLSLDGHGAFVAGQRAVITGPSGSSVTQILRSRVDAVLVSAATVIADNPALTVRDATGVRASRQPIRVVLVRDTVPPPDAAVFTDGLAETTVLLVGSGLGEAGESYSGARVVRAEGSSLADALRALGSLGLDEVLIEPGPRLFSAAWEAGVLDQVVTVTAGGCAGEEAPPIFTGTPDRMGAALVGRMRPHEAGIVSDVSVTAWRPFGQSRE
jgi:diaminohydroxyphosphoribosylaminopyrimidine deaminase/5-amino-6-(5-phosphoribosylamino)uracil reductase